MRLTEKLPDMDDYLKANPRLTIEIVPEREVITRKVEGVEAGAWVGLWLVPLARIIPRKVLQGAKDPCNAWHGPGGGVKQPVPLFRRLWVPLVNACLWAYAADTACHSAFWAVLSGAGLASTLVLLALIDWDTTMLPDLVVLPLGVAGLASSYAGFTPPQPPR